MIIRVFFILTMLASLSCGEKDGGGESEDTDGKTELTSSEQVAIRPESLSGTNLIFEVEDKVEVDTKETRLIGEAEGLGQLMVQPLASTGDGTTKSYVVQNVPPGSHDLIVQGQIAGLGLDDMSVGTRVNGIEFIAGKNTDAGFIQLYKLGRIVGKAFLAGKGNHKGIKVYIPGYSTQATTKKDGSYVIGPYIVPGIQNLAFENFGYEDQEIKSIDVEPGKETEAPDMILIRSTGPQDIVFKRLGFNQNTKMMKFQIYASQADRFTIYGGESCSGEDDMRAGVFLTTENRDKKTEKMDLDLSNFRNNIENNVLTICIRVFDQFNDFKIAKRKIPIIDIDCSTLAGVTWIGVPGDSDYGTSDFCVMKYEAKDVFGKPASNASGSPWVFINQNDAKSECMSLGAVYGLISNPQWMTIAANLANVGSNWGGGSVGSGALSRGHSFRSPNNTLAAVSDDNEGCTGTGQNCSSSVWDDQRRTHTLSNGEVIWDLAGNVREWVNYYEPDGKATTASGTWSEYPSVGDGATTKKKDLVPTNAIKPWWDDSWTRSQNIGSYGKGTEGKGGALDRGGHMGTGGVFGAIMYMGQDYRSANVGFRCVAVPK